MDLAGAIATVLLTAWGPTSAGGAILSKQEQIGLLNEAQKAFDRGTTWATPGSRAVGSARPSPPTAGPGG